ncbi:MAG: hypothetical protein AUK48_12765 [Oscillatoriales cyanobacterium CG2_30_44_21]|nr:MAG: hypothetical protein AUK48_12765 [Oscillatoriales cyanobacterium CG2_30_44_21]
MPKIPFSIAAIAIVLIGCQQNPSNSSTGNSLDSAIASKAISYLRTELNLSADLAIVAESQKKNPANINDLCQAMPPVEEGLEISLVAAGQRYILQTNADASKIELCHSEDAQPPTSSKYTGAGYLLRYPSDWQVTDLGLEPTGTSTVIFTPTRFTIPTEQSLDQILQGLQQSHQIYTAIAKRAVDNQSISSDLVASEVPKDLITTPLDTQSRGFKSGTKRRFNTSRKDKSGSEKIGNIEELTFVTEQFIYTIRHYQPSLQPDMAATRAFEEFVDSFTLIP